MTPDLTGRRVVVLTKVVHPQSGVGAAVMHYSVALRALGASPEVVLLTSESEGADVLEAAGFGVRVLGLPKHGHRLDTSRAVHAALAQMAPDWVHAHCYEPAVHTSRAIRWGLRTRLAVIIHDSRRRLRRRATAWPSRDVPDIVIAPSASAAEVMGAWYGYAPERRLVLPHPVEDRFLKPLAPPSELKDELGIVDAYPTLLWTARLQRAKGHADLLRALAMITPEFPRACLLLAGDGKTEPGLRRLARALGVAENVRFLGRRSDVRELLAVSDVFVCPSHAETLCMSVQEAMAAGKPVVSTAVWGPDEYITDGDNGVLVPVGRPPKMARAISALAADAGRAEALGEAARRYAADHFSPESFAARLGEAMVGAECGQLA